MGLQVKFLSRWRELTSLVFCNARSDLEAKFMRMSQKNAVLFVAVFALLALAVSPAAAESSPSVDVYGLPLAFIQNEGQVRADVLYHANAPAHSIYFTKESVVCTLGAGDGSPEAVEITLAGHSPNVVIKGEGKLEGTANFFIGNEPGSWVRGVPTYGSVRYENILPGVDIVYSGTQGVLKRDIVVSPGIDPSVIRFRYTGQDALALDSDRNLIVKTAGVRSGKQPQSVTRRGEGRECQCPAPIPSQAMDSSGLR